MDTDRILAEKYMRLHPLKAARFMESLPHEELAGLLGDTPASTLTPVLNEMGANCLAKVLPMMPKTEVGRLMEKMDRLNVQNVLRQLDPKTQKQVLKELKPDLASAMKRNLDQVSGTVGALMLPVTVVLQPSMNVKEALEYLKKHRNKSMNPLLVVNKKGELMGEIPLQSLLLANKTELLSQLMVEGLPALLTDTSLTAIRDHPAWEKYPSLPVNDRSNHLVGILPADLARQGNGKRELLTKEILETTSALGELYRIGLAGFLQSVNRRT